VTIPTVAGVVYQDASDNSTLTAGAQPALADGESLTVVAVPTSGRYFSNNVDDQWTFENRA
jgi:hypothetical protein